MKKELIWMNLGLFEKLIATNMVFYLFQRKYIIRIKKWRNA